MTLAAVEHLIQFDLPNELAAHEPPEARGLARDEVRLMVSRPDADTIHHTRFTQLAEFLEPRDLLVVNTSATINASLPARRAAAAKDDSNIRLHLSTQLSPTRWVVELRRVALKGSAPLLDASTGDRLLLPGGAEARLIGPWLDQPVGTGNTRLWIADLVLPNEIMEYTARYGEPIRYSYVPKPWPLSFYQTIFALEPGSAEMPSAGRPFTPRVLAALTERGVRIVTITLHTGVSSLEGAEPPYPERFLVPAETSDAVNTARRGGSHVIAVGTTVVRALETVASQEGWVRANQGWTHRLVTPENPPRVVDGLITGLHAPNASHLAMLEAIAGREHLARAYEAALHAQYLWHEFGDIHFIAPRRTAGGR